MGGDSTEQRGWVIGLTYATAFGVYGVLLPFLPLILHAKGLNDAETSIALSAYGIAALFAPIVFAHLADRRIPFRRLMPALLAATALFTPLLGASNSVITAFLAVLVFFFFLLPAMSLLDSFTLDFIIRSQTVPKPRFQDFRVWGSIGFMLPVLGLLVLTQWWEARPFDLITMAVAIAVVSAVVTWFLPGNVPLRHARELPSKQALRNAKRSPVRELFLATSISGLGLSIFYIIFPRYLQELGCSTLEIGLIINLGVLCEVVLIPFAGRMMAALSVGTVIMLGILSLPVRLLALALWPGITTVLLTQWLHAPLVVGFFVAVPIYLQENTAPSYRHSMQSLNISIALGLTRFIGPWLGALALGFGSDTMGGLLNAMVLSAVLGGIGAWIFYLAPRGEGGPVPEAPLAVEVPEG